ncbi:hypothetical protein TREES_T100014628 [Tupaia chinensis]|uniref:Uncharacterized protein n=1 Tax=Tupaia chinensis TaxID=246437 RepID=L9KX50_TUPCH|nr:hypothetical protein TREES_T100014628 [Tupaia chinensis]
MRTWMPSAAKNQPIELEPDPPVNTMQPKNSVPRERTADPAYLDPVHRRRSRGSPSQDGPTGGLSEDRSPSCH